jgi:tetratricopeptide (TPR) repeat protein
MKKIILIFSFLISIQNAFTQRIAIESFVQKIAAEENDNKRIDLFNNFFASISEVDPALDMQYAQKLLVQSQKNNDKIIEAIALSQIGYDYRAFGNTSKSLEYNLKATSLSKQIGNEKLISSTALNLAHIYKDQAVYFKAINIYMAAAESSGKSNDYLIRCWAFNSLSQVYLEMNKLDSALMYAQRAYEICVQIESYILSGVLKNMGSIHGKIGNSVLAVSFFDMAIKEAYRTNSPRWINDAHTGLAQYYHNVNLEDSSLVNAKKAIAIVQNTAYSNMSIKPAKLLLAIYKNKNSDSALKYSEIYRMANDSLFSLKTIQQTQVLSFENELQQKELASEKRKNESQRKQNIQMAFIAFGIISFIILFLLLSRSFITNTRLIEFFGVMALLIVFEFLNLLLHPFLERVTNHTPLLMLLALVSIAGLLIPLHHRLEKWATQKLIEKNKSIRLLNAKKTIAQLEKKTASNNQNSTDP